MANAFYNRGASFNPDELADGDAIEAEFNAVSRGFDTIEDLVNANKAGYPTQTFHVATATESTHAVPKAQMDTALGFKLNAVNYNATDVLNKLKTVDGSSSGLDADLLDGQEGAYYRNANNINAGTLAKERLPASIDASTTGNAATATTLQNARTINSISFNGGSNITVEPYIETDSTAATRYITFVDSITAGYQRLNMDGGLTYNPSTNLLGASISGSAATATTLQTARTINGVSFNGSANITAEPYVEQDTGTNAARYLTFVDSSTAGYQRLNLDTAMTYNPSTNLLSVAVTSDINDVGKVCAFARNSAPLGYLKCNGAAISRTTYAALFSAIGTTFGIGDGSTTFNIPDLRGEFIRGWDDARGVDTSRAFGSWQDGQNVSHTHAATVSSDAHTHTWSGTTTTAGAHQHGTGMYHAAIGNGSSLDPDEVKGNGGGGGYLTSSSGSHAHTVSGTTSSDSHTHTVTNAASGGTEVRVRNRAMLYCIKY